MAKTSWDMSISFPEYTDGQRLQIVSALRKACHWTYSDEEALTWNHRQFFQSVAAYGFKPSQFNNEAKAIESKPDTEAGIAKRRRLAEQRAHDAVEDAQIAYDDFVKTWWVHIAGLGMASAVGIGSIGIAMIAEWWIGLIVVITGMCIFVGAAVTVCQRYFTVHGQEKKKDIRQAQRKLRDLITDD